MRRPGFISAAALALAVVAISSSAPMIAYATAPALAIAFWRNAFAVTALTPFAATVRRRELRELFDTPDGRRIAFICVLSGLALAVHFGTWVPSAKLTSPTATLTAEPELEPPTM